ncbi:DNA-binding response OmpR family regulator [Spirosoma lacussanchae]|uniref:response regulator n=1 Tax=Spirosoma lacussanchae TaxID=1884249 RepID=UPI0011091EBC|nr:response regulator [Spirosoma lacussanchae]
MDRKHRLLIVDQNPYVADILVQTLRQDFAITVAKSGQEAAQLIVQGCRFDCVLTELNLPSLGGLELTRLIRTNRLMSHIPVVALSDAHDSDTRIRSLEEGVDNVVLKPFNPLEVKAKLHALLRRTVFPVEEGLKRPVLARTQPRTNLLRQLRSRVMSLIL